ncbi:hypothetical protein E2562_037004 [Oryza meyeriana var. granulata]|uniref:RING-CH-type domain-containing protein n=1 Tax=Oryza meyeriana var. granulata TaxID=110450 RepID=A0A6G1CVZ9_9ORYZ|nr:hypothetical protein E2562_037004 [Oryza meyeriana var. granulata]
MAQHAQEVNTSSSSCGSSIQMEGDRAGVWPLLVMPSSKSGRNDHQELASAADDAFGEPPADPKKPSSGMTSRLLPARSLRSTGAGDDGEVAAAVAGTRSLSFSKLFSFRIATTAHSSSLSALDFDHQSPADAASSDHPSFANDELSATKTKTKTKQTSHQMNICRSQSVPMSTLSRFSSKGGGSKRVADSSSLRVPDGGSVRFRVSVISATPDGNSADDAAAAAAAGEEDAGSVEAEEEALVCRICMVALSEEAGSGGGGTLKLECRCKGELALAHGDCAVKWFSIKGNATCDICNHEVLNLPVTLRRVHDRQQLLVQEAAAAAAAAAGDDIITGNRRGGYSYGRVWRGTTILVIVSMLAYFCFLEQLLVGDHGTAALAISLPFACVLGLFSSLTTTKMGIIDRLHISDID